MKGISLSCFGVGDGWPSANRRHSSFLYRIEDSALLIDCGEPVSRAIKASGLGYDLIDRILISHLHCDHIGGFFMLMQGFWLEHRTRELPVHIPEYAIKPVRAMLDAAYIFEELLPFNLRFVPLEANRTLSNKAIRITPVPTTHLESLRAAFQEKHPQPFVAFSFLIETENLRIVHSADLGAPEDLIPLLDRPVDLLVCELAHFAPEAIFNFLRDFKIGRIIFIHLGGSLWEKLEEIEELARISLPNIPFCFARDGDQFHL